MLFFFLAGHALMDFALQSDTMAACKCRHSKHPVQVSVPWPYWLSAHALLHGAVVGVTVRWFEYSMYAAVALAMAETIAHWVIDFGKCTRLYGIHADQGLHLLCKIAWWAVADFTYRTV